MAYRQYTAYARRGVGQPLDTFTPIIIPPLVALFVVNRLRNRPVPDDSDGTFRPTIRFGLKIDHRVVTVAGAARFLETLGGSRR